MNKNVCPPRMRIDIALCKNGLYRVDITHPDNFKTWCYATLSDLEAMHLELTATIVAATMNATPLTEQDNPS